MQPGKGRAGAARGGRAGLATQHTLVTIGGSPEVPSRDLVTPQLSRAVTPTHPDQALPSRVHACRAQDLAEGAVAEAERDDRSVLHLDQLPRVRPLRRERDHLGNRVGR